MMKKTLKNRIKKWKLGDYVRQFSIVTGGVLLTLWLTDFIAESSKQKQVRQAMQLVVLELHNNMQSIQEYKEIYESQRNIALRMQESEFATADLPADTAQLYWQHLYGGLALSTRFSTDALEMLKTSGLTTHIADKQLVIDLLHCYNSIEVFGDAMDLYFDRRKNIIFTYNDKHLQKKMPTRQEDFIELFGQMTADPDIQSWLYGQPRSFDTRFFEVYSTKIEETIHKLDTAYK